jgi:diadenosine tetraphosphate (Ap4A) HIT family hydrolase
MADLFQLHPQLAADTVPVTDLSLCHVLLMDEPVWPWLILVPRRAGVREIIDLPAPERAQLMEEIAQVSAVLQRLYRPVKLNVAALGNQVPQLHVHAICRFADDPAWPKPVWGAQPRQYYATAARAARVAELRAAFA